MEQAHVRNKPADKPSDKPSLALARHYPVAPEKVWRAWTDPQALRQWFGPGGPQPVSVADLDLRAGGRFRLVFGGPDGHEHEAAGVYKEVRPHRKLVFSWCWPRTTPDRVSQITILLRGWGETFIKLETFLTGAVKS